jgi:hypothetical protein
MLLAGDPVVVSIESAVVRDPDVVEPSAALEVRYRIDPLRVWSWALSFPTPCEYSVWT